MPTAASTSYLGMAMQANLEQREISPEVVEDLKHHRFMDDTRDRIMDVNSTSGNSGTIVVTPIREAHILVNSIIVLDESTLQML